LQTTQRQLDVEEWWLFKVPVVSSAFWVCEQE